MTINYAQINARATNLLLSVKKHVSSIDSELQALVELRVSQINGCAYCIALHSNQARDEGTPQHKLHCLSIARESQFFTGRELSALSWAESVTNISSEQNIEARLHELLRHFNETEVVDLTLIIALMNCLNRMSISLGAKPSPKSFTANSMPRLVIRVPTTPPISSPSFKREHAIMYNSSSPSTNARKG